MKFLLKLFLAGILIMFSLLLLAIAAPFLLVFISAVFSL